MKYKAYDIPNGPHVTAEAARFYARLTKTGKDPVGAKGFVIDKTLGKQCHVTHIVKSITHHEEFKICDEYGYFCGHRGITIAPAILEFHKEKPEEPRICGLCLRAFASPRRDNEEGDGK